MATDDASQVGLIARTCVLCLVVFASGMAGCGSSSEDAQSAISLADSAPAGYPVNGMNSDLIDGLLPVAPAISAALDVAIDSCMRTAGFRYFPIEPVVRTPIEIDDPEFRAMHGYGIAERRRASNAQAPELNPNQAYYESLGPSAQRAYDTALTGDGGEQTEIPLTDAKGQQTGTLLAGGCEYAAYGEVYGVPKEVIVQDISTLEAMRDGMIDRVNADSRVRDAKAKWTRCMADKGWPEAEDRWYLRDALTQQFDAEGASLNDIEATERRAAADDTSCSESSGVDQLLRRAWFSLDAEFSLKASEILDKYNGVPLAAS